MTARPNIVLVHGAWADGSSWSGVIERLQADGYHVTAPQFPLTALADDVARLRHVLDLQDGPTIVAAHSYGGQIATALGADAPNVAGLVYISALAPDEDETSQSLQDQFPVTDVFSHIEIADGRIWLLPSGIGCFAGDLSEQEQGLVWATQGVPDVNLFGQKLGGTAWRMKPSWYIVANNDRTVHPDLERFAAKRMGAHTYDVDSSHVPMLSRPDFVLGVIREAANSV